MKVVLVGNPNTGKTSIFNGLTSSEEKVGNWSGVTTYVKEALFSAGLASQPITSKNEIKIADLPGISSLNIIDDHASLDEVCAVKYLCEGKVDLILNIIDASNLERSLYLTMQLLELGLPMICLINKLDLLDAEAELSTLAVSLFDSFGCRVLLKDKLYLVKLAQLIQEFSANPSSVPVPSCMQYTAIVENEISLIQHELQVSKEVIEKNNKLSLQLNRRDIVGLLEGDLLLKDSLPLQVLSTVKHAQRNIKIAFAQDADIFLAMQRHEKIAAILGEGSYSSIAVNKLAKAKVAENAIDRQSSKFLAAWKSVFRYKTKTLDGLFLHKYLGLPVFFFIMYLMFFISVKLSGVLQDFFEISASVIFASGSTLLLQTLSMPDWTIAVFAHGLGMGMSTVASFIPVLGVMFFSLAFLEESGYMARGAFLVDRIMRVVGLPGKSFVPMIVGFGCNVNSVVGSRILEGKKDRILTIMISPFMSCSARLAIFSVFVTAFFPDNGQNIIFALYMIGILMAVLTGLLLKNTLLSGNAQPMILELNEYQFPNLKLTLRKTWRKLYNFTIKSSKIIVPICVLLGAISHLNFSGSLVESTDDNTIVSRLGQTVTPIFAPMGIKQDNWQASVALISGAMAKEAVIGTLNSLYSNKTAIAEIDNTSLLDGLGLAVYSIWDNVQKLSLSQTENSLGYDMDSGVLGNLYKKFDGKIGAFAYLLFTLLYLPCITVTAAMYKEVGSKWTTFCICWTTGIAYIAAVSFYQIGTFFRHPLYSSIWLLIMLAVLGVAILVIAKASRVKGRSLPTRVVIE